MRSQTVILAICALVGFLAVAIVAAVLHGPSDESTPLILTLAGLVSTTVVALLALLKIESVEHKVDEVHTAVNGVADETHTIAEATANGPQ